ncbi:MAG: NADH dehydrogenase [ubiquinone] 1 alpha subcomplex assembly factor 1 [Flavobacteriales bacterium]|jgi:NADH dehydrogenase [ubiquinone] 1 alpha subcomplex assembly factor 1
MAPSHETLLEFGELADSFRPVDDRVMGGVSQSRMERAPDGHAVFRGRLSRENNGGFASIRASGLALDVSAMSTLVLRVRGDGRRYKLRLHDNNDFDRGAFQTEFETVADEWVELTLPLDGFRPVWRGRVVTGAAPLNRGRIVSLGLMISDGQEGEFELELDWLAGS